MVVTLYTSRVILQTLGEEDFGIYNIVGGIVVLFTFINTAMTTGTQRHLSYELGKEGGNVIRSFLAVGRYSYTIRDDWFVVLKYPNEFPRG